jgi:hypothetical protein
VPSEPVVPSRAVLVGFLKDIMKVEDDTTKLGSFLILFLNTQVKVTKGLEAVPLRLFSLREAAYSIP